MHWVGASWIPILPSGRSALQGQTTVQVCNGVMAMRIVAAGTNHSEPETAIPLKDQNGLCASLAMAIQQGHAELFSHLRPLGALAQATQQRIHLREGNETGAVGVGDQDQTIQPLHFLKQLFNAGQQLRQRKRQTGPPLRFSSDFLRLRRGVSQATQVKIHALRIKTPICPATSERWFASANPACRASRSCSGPAGKRSRLFSR